MKAAAASAEKTEHCGGKLILTSGISPATPMPTSERGRDPAGESLIVRLLPSVALTSG